MGREFDARIAGCGEEFGKLMMERLRNEEAELCRNGAAAR